MMKQFLAVPGGRFAIQLGLAIAVAATAAAQGDEHRPISRIAFGSCAEQDEPQPIWNTIVESHPDLFLFIGDNIYGDTEDMSVMKAKYARLAAQPGFKKLRATCPLLAVWDDHDYGVNDGGAEYPKRKESQQVFNDFYQVTADSPRRQRAGIYDAAVFGPAEQRVQIILLDTRYFRGPLVEWPRDQRHRTHGPYRPNTDPSVTVLGDDQWNWLAQQLKKPAALRIIVSSIQVLADEHGWESWGNFPHQREKLFRTIADTKAAGVILVSGDRHMAELSRATTEETRMAYPLYDLTSSSLNRPGGGQATEPNRNRVGPRYGEVNFGTISVDWGQADPSIVLVIHDVSGKTALRHALRLSELSPKTP